MEKYKVYSRLNPPPSVGLDFTGTKSMTDPSFKDECDMNTILKRYRAGQIPPNAIREGAFGDFCDFHDYQTLKDKVVAAHDNFEALPSNIRARFGNSPDAFMQFVLDPANEAECIRLGFRVKKEVKKDVTASAAEPTHQQGEGKSANT